MKEALILYRLVWGDGPMSQKIRWQDSKEVRAQ
ncbi:hypothetical protein ES703_13570 [subsurface metagenome]